MPSRSLARLILSKTLWKITLATTPISWGSCVLQQPRAPGRNRDRKPVKGSRVCLNKAGCAFQEFTLELAPPGGGEVLGSSRNREQGYRRILRGPGLVREDPTVGIQLRDSPDTLETRCVDGAGSDSNSHLSECFFVCSALRIKAVHDARASRHLLCD